MFDTEKFILCVQENTAIWCLGSKEYKDFALRELSWDIVGRHMYEDKWPDMTDVKYRPKVVELKNKWKHLRVSYIRHLHLLKTKKLKRKLNYVYGDELKFLLPTFGANQASRTSVIQVKKDDDFENTSQPEEEQKQVQEYVKRKTPIRRKSVKPRKKENTSQPEEEQEYIKQNTGIRVKNVEPRETENTSQPEEEQEYIKQNTRIRIKSVEPRENENGSEPKGMFRKRKQTSCSLSQSELNETSDDDDGYKLFFLSMLPEFRKLNDRQKLEFRLHNLQYFCDLEQKKTSQTGK